ncbi:hypothetical protein GPECTOR_1g806 [Gonium pectorale]|uniref:Thymidine kinase n=1 Tax=Gonium pectorale TaxID=33097 RepID=A0A150H499_GONPE|nr:hypothetical protein GPECTOR_1g806 [Gonium pectorale]|eukprot:KXZ56894.1 hypothetical protein GPECTOR_1g806 [Gonium pectorale]
MGSIHIIMGPMFAGKTTALIDRVEDAQRLGQAVVVVKSAVDTRYSVDQVVTHSGRRVPCFALQRLGQLRGRLGEEAYRAVQVVAVDEAQFLEGLVDDVRAAAEEDGKTVIVAGLNGDFRRQRFGQILDLVPLSDTVKKLRGRCKFCEQPSLFTLRIAASTQQQLVGGADAYAPVCREHYHDLEAVRRAVAAGVGAAEHPEPEAKVAQAIAGVSQA